MNGQRMAEKLGLGSEVRELKLGPTFSNSKGTAFHTLRYDFKPASVDENKVATVDVGQNHQVTVTVPHLDGSGTMQTVFKGSHRPYQRECVLIIDKITGEITLEKLANNIQLKKTRMEPTKGSSGSAGASVTASAGSSHSGRATPTENKSSPSQRQSHKPPKGLGMPLPKHSPLPASPSYNNKSPSVYKSPPQLVSSMSLSPVTSGSLPMIGLDDPLENAFSSPNITENLRHSPSPYFSQMQDQDEDQVVSRVGVLSASSSSNSSSDNDSSDSESDSTPSNNNNKQRLTNGDVNGTVPVIPSADVLQHDLELSESGSDSDC